jgi:hypothetical protein
MYNLHIICTKSAQKAYKEIGTKIVVINRCIIVTDTSALIVCIYISIADIVQIHMHQLDASFCRNTCTQKTGISIQNHHFYLHLVSVHILYNIFILFVGRDIYPNLYNQELFNNMPKSVMKL